MPYFNIDLDYFNHPKTLLLEAALGGHRGALIPIKLWAHVGKYHCEDGFLKDYTPETIAKAVEVDSRNAEKLVEALIKCGFIAQKKGGFQVHEWNQHNGHLALFRERGRIAANARWGKTKNPDKPASEKPKAASPAPGKKQLFTEEQAREIRVALARKCKHLVVSEANEAAWKDLYGKVERANRKKKIDNLFAYAMTAAMTYGDSPK